MDGTSRNSTDSIVIEHAARTTPATDPCGRVFLSYRRTHADDMVHIAGALLDRGVPIWQDIRDLGAEPLAPALRSALASPSTSGALVWISADIRGSSAILELEAPSIHRRDRDDSIFFADLRLADGIGYEEAADVYRPAGLLMDIAAERNLPRAVVDPATKRIGAAEAARIAREVLARRLSIIHRELPRGEPLRVLLGAHGEADLGEAPGYPLQVNWSRHFTHRIADPLVWSAQLLPAILDISRAVRKYASGRALRVEGRATLAAALAIGYAFRTVAAVPMSWIQTPGPIEISLDVAPASSGCFVEPAREQHLGSKDLAVLVCVTGDVEPALNETADHPRFRAVVKVRPRTDVPRVELREAGQFVELSRLIVDAVRAARHQIRSIERTHLYFAGPAGLAVLVGQQLNALGPVHLYEHQQHGSVGRYVPAAILSDQTV